MSLLSNWPGGTICSLVQLASPDYLGCPVTVEPCLSWMSINTAKNVMINEIHNLNLN